MPAYQKIVLIAVAGAFGTVSRYGVSVFVAKHAGNEYPWGTLAVNIAGCFFVGLLAELFHTKLAVSAEMRTIILVGFFGAFTTFATYIFDSSDIIADANWTLLAANVAAQNVLGFVGLFAGIALARVF